MWQQWMRLSLSSEVLQNVENNHDEDKDAVDRVRALVDRIDDRSLPL